MTTPQLPQQPIGKPICQTPFGRFLCWLGVHQIIPGQPDPTSAHPSYAAGRCVRCDRPCGWDL